MTTRRFEAPLDIEATRETVERMVGQTPDVTLPDGRVVKGRIVAARIERGTRRPPADHRSRHRRLAHMTENYVPWECPRCGKAARANLDVLGPLGWVTCTCGTTSRPAT